VFSKLQVINTGLAKIASSQIERIDPPRTSLEVFVAGNYPQWKRSELAKRRWVFATELHYKLPLTETLTGTYRPFKYLLPVNCLRPIRGRRTEWVQSRRSLYSADPALEIDYIADVDEPEFDPMFVDVFAWRIAIESVEYVTQSNTKKADAKSLYDDAVRVAGQMNAYVIGPEDNTYDENDYPFLTARY